MIIGLDFNAPLYLAGAATLTVPFLMLLTKAKTRRVVSFSSTEFLSQITQKATNVIQWKRLLLLLTRIMILAAVTFAFAMPFISKTGGLSFGAPRLSRIYILDASYSMGYLENGESLFERAKKEILNSLSDLTEPAYLSLYTFDQTLEPVVEKSRDVAQFKEMLDPVRVSNLAGDYSKLLDEVRTIRHESKSPQNEIWIFSDYSVFDPVQKKIFMDQLQKSGWGPELRMIPVRPSLYRNIALTGLVMPEGPLLAGAPYPIKTAYRCWGMNPEEGFVISFSVNGKKAGEQAVVCPDNGFGDFVFEIKFPESGPYGLMIESGADALLVDNQRYAAANVFEGVKILMLDDSVTEYPFQKPFYYFDHVLQSYSASQKIQWFETVNVDSQEFLRLPLENYNLIMAADLKSLDAKAASSLKYFVRKGGSFFYAAGESQDVQALSRNEPFVSLVGGYFGIPERAEGNAAYWSIHTAAYEHPIFRVFEKGMRGDLSRIPFKAYAPFMMTDAQAAPEVLLWMDYNKPLLIEKKEGRGRVFLWASSLNDDWNQFPKDPLYVPFMLELLKYVLLGDTESIRSYVPGDSIPIRFEGSGEGLSAQLTNPAGEQTKIFLSPLAPEVFVPAAQTGFYEWEILEAEPIVREKAAVNPDVKESEPGFLDPEVFAQAAGRGADVLVQEVSRFDARSYVYGKFLLLAFILLLIEAQLANRFYKAGWV